MGMHVSVIHALDNALLLRRNVVVVDQKIDLLLPVFN
jgi:hypothetical protein